MVGRVKYAALLLGKLSFMVLGGFGVLGALVVALFVWRVSSGPLDISFIKGTIEAAIYDEKSGSYASMDKAVLFWPDMKGSLYLQLHNGQLFNKDGGLIVGAAQFDVSFSGAGLLAGRIMPEAIIVKEPAVRLERGRDGSFAFDIGIEQSGNDVDSVGFEGGAKAAIGEFLSYMSGPVREDGGEDMDSLFSRLRGFSIEDARLFVDDKVVRQTWSLPDFDLVFMSTDKGAGGFASMALPGSKEGGAALKVAIEYDWWEGKIEFSTDVVALNVNDIIGKIPALNIPATQDAVIDAHIELTLDDKNFMPSQMRVDVYSKEGKISHPGLSDESVVYSDMSLSALYDYGGKVTRLSDTHISLGGVTFDFSGELTRENDKIYGPVRISAKDVAHSSVEKIWPKFLEGEDAEKWVVKRMADGSFEEIMAGFSLLVEKVEDFEGVAPDFIGPGKPYWDIDFNKVLLDFKAKDMTVDYHSPLPKAYHVYGSGRLDVDNDSLSIEIEKAKIGALEVGKSKLYFDALIEEGVGDADMRFAVKSTIADVLRFVSNEPINIGDSGMDLDKVKGDADLNIWLHFPAREDVRLKDFKIDIGGDLKDVLFPEVVGELDITGGPLKIFVKDNQVEVKGAALLDGREIDLLWEAFLKSKGQAYKEKVVARLRVDEELRSKLGIDLTTFLKGPVDADVIYTSYRDGSAHAKVSTDIAQAFLFIDPFDYNKPVGQKAVIDFDAYLKGGKLQKIINLAAKAPDFSMEKGEISFTEILVSSGGVAEEEKQIALASGFTPHFTLGETVSSLSFAYDEKRAVDISMEASFMDAQPFMDAENGEEEYIAPPMRITAKARKMRTSPGQSADNVRAYMEIDGRGRFDQIEMDAHIGTSDVFIRFDEKGSSEGKRTFRMKTQDAGALLKAFGVYDNVIGGTMAIYGEPMRWMYDRNIRGLARISDFKVVKAPVLAKLLSLLSLSGIGEVLSNEGLHFDKMEVDFDWLYRRKGSLLNLKNGRTSGNTLGILFEGGFDNEKREVDVSGTVAPMDTLNKVLNKIPLIGGILTGGEGGGLFAATYSIKGSSEKPEISVNPLSVLTPGILRRILWE